MIEPLPPHYSWVSREPHPKILKEALKLHGTTEISGASSSPTILHWAAEIGGWLGGYYNDDSIPWCGLFVGICAKRAGFPFGQQALSALAWLAWGQRAGQPSLGDVLVFKRPQGGHVGFYICEDEEAYHVLGGNQSDKVCISRISKQRLVQARRCRWKLFQPQNIRPIICKSNGLPLSLNES